MPPNEPDALFASKSLSLLWLSPSFHSPFLTSGVWHWRVDLAFGAWVVQAVRVVKQKSLDLDPTEANNAHVVRNYLEELKAGTWGECKKLADAGPVRLPGSEIISGTLQFVRCGDVPEWDGWRKAWDFELGERLGQPAPSPHDDPPAPPAARKQTRSARVRRSDDAASLF